MNNIRKLLINLPKILMILPSLLAILKLETTKSKLSLTKFTKLMLALIKSAEPSPFKLLQASNLLSLVAELSPLVDLDSKLVTLSPKMTLESATSIVKSQMLPLHL